MPTIDQSLTSTFSQSERVLAAVGAGFDGKLVLVVGDVMLDQHLWGSVTRISPEAPVPVVRCLKRTLMAGGAGNVAMNLVGLGLTVSLVALVGEDEAATQIREELGQAGVDVDGVLSDRDRPTTTKMRVIGGHQQMLRLDSESTQPPSPELEDALLRKVVGKLEKASAVILSDYAKGVLTPSLCQGIIRAAKLKGIPVLVDPKGKEWEKYRGATRITPNRSELVAVSASPLTDRETLIRESRKLREQLDLQSLTVTLSEEGMIQVDAQEVIQVPAMAREVFDVSGAGDTAIATLTAALAAGLDACDCLVLANIAAGIVVGKVGTVALGKSELLAELEAKEDSANQGKVCEPARLLRLVDAWKARGERVVFTNGCFDILHAGHVSYLAKARTLGDRLVLGLNSDASVRRLKGPTRPINPQEQRAVVLAGLGAVDAVVVFDEDTPLELIKTLRPQVLAKGADYRAEDVVGGAEVLSWGGEVKLVDLVDGVSTTKIAAKISTAQG
ncbi:MAG: D-glycero-beta-D-manno-heptose-7-phosphate kinase [Fibrobacterota bacterium]|jgi:D-beta-D-heptose 7-phosphate kinase/D-beta-D-heptose 1-phosphate adenosyltransferase